MLDFLWGRGETRLSRLVAAARLALAAQALARALAPALTICGLFVAVSLFGPWLGASAWTRMAGVGLLVVALVVALAPLRRFRLPSAEDARAALDASDLFSPASALSDQLANASDPRTEALWRLHRAQAERRAEALRPIAPRPQFWRIDPRAIGALTVLLLCAGVLVAGPEFYARVAAAFDWRWSSSPGAAARVDAWIDPPAYTGRPPIALRDAAGGPVAAPVGSLVVIRAARPEDLRVTARGGLTPSAVETPNGGSRVGGAEQHFVLRGDGELQFGPDRRSFALRALADAPPKIAFLGASKPLERGGFVVAYRIEDDYGAHDAQIAARPPEPRAGAHPLIDPPSGPLELAPGPGGLGEAKTTLDWTDSPYAGEALDLILSAHDDAGQQGVAIAKAVVLPEKIFRDPLARALVEQRRLLASDAGAREKVEAALEALMLSPDQFTPDAGVYLSLHFAARALRDARSDEDLRETVAFLWQLALAIEDGDVPQAERDFKAAEQALRDALKRGASPAEIARLTAELKKALNAYLEALRAQNKNGGEASEGGANDKALSPQDVQAMLDQMSRLAQDGDKQNALSALDQLDDLLNRLRSGSSRAAQQAAQSRRMMRDLDSLMREQQKLRDDTLGESPNPPNPPNPPSDGAPAGAQNEANGADHAARQGELRRQLDALRSQNGAPELQDAESAMKEAEQALRSGDDAGAGAAQGRALDAMRQAAAELAEQGQSGPQGPSGEQGGAGYRGREGDSSRGQGSRAQPVEATSAEKARKVLEELRRRLSDPSRGRDELDYLERLLKPD